MIRARFLRLVTAVAVLAVMTFGTASAVASISAPNLPSAIGLPAGKFLLLGDVARRQILDVAALRAPSLAQRR